MQEFIFLKQAGESLDAQFEVVNDAAQGLSLNGNAAMHGDNDSGVVSRTHIDRMTAGLSSKLEPQSSYDPDHILAG